MNQPTIMQANAQLRYDVMLDAAEKHRRVRRLTRHNHGLRARIRLFLSDVLFGIFDWLKLQRRKDAEMAGLND